MRYTSTGRPASPDRTPALTLPQDGAAGQFLMRTPGGCVWAEDNDTTYGAASSSAPGLVRMAANVSACAGETPTAEEFDALLAALKNAGLMAPDAALTPTVPEAPQ